MVQPVQYRLGHDRSARAQGDADEVAAAPAHPLADRVRLALTPYGAVLGCNRCSTSSTGFANGLHSAGSPSQDTRAVGSQSVAHKANLLSGSGNAKNPQEFVSQFNLSQTVSGFCARL